MICTQQQQRVCFVVVSALWNKRSLIAISWRLRNTWRGPLLICRSASQAGTRKKNVLGGYNLFKSAARRALFDLHDNLCGGAKWNTPCSARDSRIHCSAIIAPLQWVIGMETSRDWNSPQKQHPLRTVAWAHTLLSISVQSSTRIWHVWRGVIELGYNIYHQTFGLLKGFTKTSSKLYAVWKECHKFVVKKPSWGTCLIEKRFYK